MKIRENIIKLSIKQLILLLLSAYVALIVSIYQDLLPIIFPKVVQELPTSVLLKLILVTTALCVLLSMLSLFIYLHLKIKLVPKFGVLWDKKDKEPYCPVHRIPLARHKTKIGNDPATGLDCHKCKEPSYPLIDDDNRRLTLAEANKLL